MKTVLFACVHNAGRSQMAAALFNREADPARAHAISAGTRPGQRVHPAVVMAMRELGIDLSGARPRLLTEDLARDSSILVTMGCGDDCPLSPGTTRLDWPLPDPRDQPIEEVRRIREMIRLRVMTLLDEHRWARTSNEDDRAT